MTSRSVELKVCFWCEKNCENNLCKMAATLKEAGLFSKKVIKEEGELKMIDNPRSEYFCTIDSSISEVTDKKYKKIIKSVIHP